MEGDFDGLASRAFVERGKKIQREWRIFAKFP